MPQVFLRHTGEKGVHGGKSKVFPHAPGAVLSPKNKAHSHRLAGHIAQCRYCGQWKMDEYGRKRTCTDHPSPEAPEGKLAQGAAGHVLWNFRSALRRRGRLAGRVLCAMHRVRAMPRTERTPRTKRTWGSWLCEVSALRNFLKHMALCMPQGILRKYP